MKIKKRIGFLFVGAIIIGMSMGSIATATCQVKCRAVEEYFTDKGSATAPGKFYFLSGTCRNFWVCDPGDNYLVNNITVIKYYEECLDPDCDATCWQSGGIRSEATCDSCYSDPYTKKEITCYTACTSYM